ncbi:unnamed protein product [Ceratitis capitata]|uniref:(Mediterranean fruit fly) hypothetical protein n=1 Tax=Ceratitis capitata TaxID=7213 RepID=A0A811VA49_CERCA|nr:unnamed protein product [Ceratitis capitata]
MNGNLLCSVLTIVRYRREDTTELEAGKRVLTYCVRVCACVFVGSLPPNKLLLSDDLPTAGLITFISRSKFRSPLLLRPTPPTNS